MPNERNEDRSETLPARPSENVAHALPLAAPRRTYEALAISDSDMQNISG